MTVKELIKKLETMPQNLKVALYCEEGECDSIATEVEVAHPNNEYPYQAEEYYCGGDSIPACEGLTEWIVIKG